jgi:retinol dehydrogenase 12
MPDNLSTRTFLHSQFCLNLPKPNDSFTGKSIIVTGSNTGMGLEAARHLVRLDAAKVILAVRTPAKGEVAARSIEESTGRKGIVAVWDLDLASYRSVQKFALRARSELDRLDVAIMNAGMMSYAGFRKEGGDEVHVTVNAVNGVMLGILLLPLLRQTAVNKRLDSILTFTGSWMHTLVSDFEEQHADNIFAALASYREGQQLTAR